MKTMAAILSVMGLMVLGGGCVASATGDNVTGDDEQIVSDEQSLASDATADEGTTGTVSEAWCRGGGRRMCVWRFGRRYCYWVAGGGCRRF